MTRYGSFITFLYCTICLWVWLDFSSSTLISSALKGRDKSWFIRLVSSTTSGPVVLSFYTHTHTHTLLQLLSILCVVSTMWVMITHHPTKTHCNQLAHWVSVFFLKVTKCLTTFALLSDLLHDDGVGSCQIFSPWHYVTLQSVHYSSYITKQEFTNNNKSKSSLQNSHSQTTKEQSSLQNQLMIYYYFWESASSSPSSFWNPDRQPGKTQTLTPKKPEHEQKGALDIQSEYILFYIWCVCVSLHRIWAATLCSQWNYPN